MSQAENVTSIQDYQAEAQPSPEQMAQEVMNKSGADMGKVAIFISLLSVLLLVVFYFGLHQNLATLSEEVHALSTLRQEVSNVNDRVSTVASNVSAVEKSVDGLGAGMATLEGNLVKVEGRVVELEKLPAKTRNMIIANDLSAMGDKMGFIGGQLDDAQAAQLKQAQQIIKDLQSSLAQ